MKKNFTKDQFKFLEESKRTAIKANELYREGYISFYSTYGNARLRIHLSEKKFKELFGDVIEYKFLKNKKNEISIIYDNIEYFCLIL